MHAAGSSSAPTTSRLEALVRRGETLKRVLEEVSSGSELRTLLTSIVREACELLGADDGSIGIYDEQRDVLRVEAAHHMPEGEVGTEARPGEGLAGRVLASRRPIVLDRYGDLGSPTRPELQENAVLGLPLFWRDQMVGFFGIGARPPRRFDAGDVESLALFGRPAAIAIEIARRYQREHTRTRRLALLAEVGRIISSGLELSQMLQNAADSIHQLLGYPNVAIPLVDPTRPSTLVLSYVGGAGRHTIDGAYRLPMSRGIIGAAATHGRVELVNDVAADPRYVPTPGVSGIRAELAVPIRLGDQILGVLNVESSEPFSEEDTTALEIAADHLALAIKNARLFSQAQQLAVLEERQRLARDLHDSVTQLLSSATMIAQSVAPAYARDPVEGERRIERVVSLNRSALAEMRALLKELRPPVPTASSSPSTAELPVPGVVRVRSEGLPAVLAEELAALERDGLVARLVSRGYQGLPPEREEVLYRIAQEALANSVKHARARSIEVELASGGGRASLRIRDDGLGFDPVSAAARSFSPSTLEGGGMGLSTMRERARHLGGTFCLRTAPGAGTEIEIAFPTAG